MTPEALARIQIDQLLQAAGWQVHDIKHANIHATTGVAIREFPLNPGHGEADYLLYVNGKACGVIEAKREGATLKGVEIQSGKYAQGLPAALPAWRRPLPFLFESTGVETQFTNGLDPQPRSRRVFAFFRPELLAQWLQTAAPQSPNVVALGTLPADEGRLVETEASIAQREGGSYQTGEQLLQRILEVRRSRPKGRSKYTKPAPPNLDAVRELPKGWTWASVEQAVAHLTDGDLQAPPQTDSGIPFLVIGNVRTGEVNLSHTRFVREDYYNALDPFRKPTKGDLLYTFVSSYGIPVRVKTGERFCIQRHMAILRPNAESPMDYLTIAMSSDTVFKQATEVSTGTAQMTVPFSGFRSFAFGLPPKAEQVRIVAEVGCHLSITSEVEAEVENNLQRAQGLRNSTLSKFFSVNPCNTYSAGAEFSYRKFSRRSCAK